MAEAKRIGSLQQAVISLVNQQFDFDALFNELISEKCDLAKLCHDNKKANDWYSVDTVVDMLHQMAAAANQPVGQLAASVCAGKVKDILHEHDGHLLMQSRLMSKLDLIWCVARKLREENAFSASTFIKIVTKQCDLPLEVVWQLHDYGILSLADYISSCLSRPSVIGQLSSRLVQMCNATLEGSTKNHRENIVCVLLGQMIRHAHSSAGNDQQGSSTSTTGSSITPNRGLKKVCMALLDSIGKKLFCNEQVEKDINIYAVVRCSSTCVNQEALKSFYKRQLGIMLSYNPVFKVSDAISCQAQWSYGCTLPFIKDAYKQILTVFEAADAVSILKRVLQQQEVNWKSVLSFTSTVLLCYSDAPSLLQEFIKDLLLTAFTDCQLDSLITAFLLARQCCHETHVWPSYQHWFLKTFGDAKTSAANVKKSFLFLLSFLTDIVPYEPASFLKVHITNPPHAPQGCKMAVSDYISLAKTQLVDLKEPLISSGIYEEGLSNTGTNNEKALRSAERDVQLALESFAKTAKVPSNVMEASIFRKPYFVGQFLAELLTARPLPDKPDVRMNFIDSLLRAGKIPLYLFEKYKKSCEKIAAQLLEGVFEVDDEMEELMLSPLEQFRSSVDQLLVLASGQKMASPDKPDISIAEQICVVREKLQVCSTSFQTLPKTIHDYKMADIDTRTMQIVDVLLNTMCRLGAGRWQHLHVDCLQRLVMGVLPCQQDVCVAFVVRLRDLLTSQSGQLELHHVRGLAAILVHLVKHQEVLISFHVKPDHFVHQLFCQVLCPSATSVKFSLWFTCCYLEYAFGAFSDVRLAEDITDTENSNELLAFVPRIVITSFIHLVRWAQCPAIRLRNANSQSDKCLHTLADGIYQSEAFKDLFEKCQPSLREWLQWEIEVSPDVHDTLRQDCLSWYLYKYFLCGSAEGQHSGESLHNCLATIFNVILDSDSVSSSEKMCDMHRVHCKQPSRASLVQFAQNLVMRSIYLDETGGDSWLINTFEKRIDESDSSAISHEVMNFVRLMQCFPAYLLFSSTPPEGSKGPQWESFHRVASMIENVWRNHLMSGDLLSLDCTLYVLQGLEVGGRHTRNHVERFLQECPLFEASLLCHWRELEAMMRGTRVEHDLFTSTCLQNISRAHSITSSSRTGTDLMTAVRDEGSSMKMWYLAAAIYSQFSKGLKPIADIIEILTTNCASSRQQMKPIAQSLQEFLIAYMTTRLLYEKPDTEATNLLLHLWSEHSICLEAVPVAQQMALFQMIHSETNQRLRPVVCMHALLGATSQQRAALRQTPAFLRSVLEVHSACLELYDNGSVAREFASSKLTNLDFLIQANHYVEETITQCPKPQLHSLDMRLIESCDLEIQGIIWKHRGM